MSENGNILLEGEVEIWRNAQWRVTSLVLEEISDGTTYGPPYWIALADLGDRDWPRHVCEKSRVDARLFVEAYREACRLSGYTPNEDGIAWALREARAA